MTVSESYLCVCAPMCTSSGDTLWPCSRQSHNPLLLFSCGPSWYHPGSFKALGEMSHYLPGPHLPYLMTLTHRMGLAHLPLAQLPLIAPSTHKPMAPSLAVSLCRLFMASREKQSDIKQEPILYARKMSYELPVKPWISHTVSDLHSPNHMNWKSSKSPYRSQTL